MTKYYGNTIIVQALQYNSIAIRVWGDIIYGINHTFKGLCVGVEGGMKRYFVTSRDYGSGFVETLMNSSLVHLMHVGKHENLPHRLGSRWICIALSLGVSSFWLCVEVWPWR